MNIRVKTYLFLCCLFSLSGVRAQEVAADTIPYVVADEFVSISDVSADYEMFSADSLHFSADSAAIAKELRREQRHLRNMNFMPDPNKSVWYALAFPGLGQIYNRKYWKLPIVYGGFVGVVYAISWNGTKYNDYMRAYRDVTDSNPNTNYHLEVIPYGYPESSAETYVKNRMNVYRRYRDISIVVGVVFYAATVIDAFVDAQLAGFDITPDLSMKIRPKFDTQPSSNMPAVGCQMQFSF